MNHLSPGFASDGILLAIDISGVTSIVGIVIYILLAMTAIWGAFCVAMVWMRVSRQRFVSEERTNKLHGQRHACVIEANWKRNGWLTAGER